MLAPLSAQETYSLIINEILKLVDGEFGSIAIRDGKRFKRIYTNSPIPLSSQIRQRGNTFQAYMSKKTILAPISKTVKTHPELEILGIKSTIHIPLSYRNKSTGALIISSKNEHKLSKHELVTLKLFGSMASLAIRKTQLYEETKNALELRDHFIAMAAHELRTPLTSVSGYIQLLYSKLANSETTESQWIEQLQEESERLKNLVNELLEINRIKLGKLNYYLKVYSLRGMLASVKQIFRFSAPDKEIIFEDKLAKDLTDKIVVDHDKILQVFTNLIENAIKYSPVASPIKIVLDFKEPDFIILIKDEGIGIPKKEFQKIFEGYQQGSGHNKEGIGMGLFLAKNILEKLYGDIKVHSKVGKGTTMEVRLPRANI
ncbi:GAF domain-containing sensor histidine kinase [Candidatus Daviesbacteria bacterium]|nr:GAF domain-containing sensor histidine kinase [Candidatus Daviesbacteria bacterium]